MSPPRDRYIYYPDCAEVPESAAVNIRNRSYTIAAEVNIETPEASGVLFSHGARFGGHSLYIKDGKLKYVYSFVGIFEQVIESEETVPTGKHILSAAFEREGQDMPTHGKLTLYINDKAVGSAEIKTQPGNFSLVGEGLNVGKDPGEPVTDDYPGERPYAFSGGQIQQVIVDVSGDHFIDIEKEAIAMMARE
jgi:arylsulfatase